MKFFIITLGCKVNQYESRMMSELLIGSGYIKAESYTDADICIINSCTVTATGDSKNRKYINRVRRENPDCIIILCGCMPQAFADSQELFRDCDIVMGNTARRDILSAINDYLIERRQIIRIGSHAKGESFEPMTVSGFDERTRAFMKIQDGCNRFCSYCIIPYARGRVRSKSLEDVKAEAEALSLNGYKEIVLVGINLSAYGQEWGLDISDAVKAVCAVDGILRVRLGSIEPERMTRDILSVLAKEKKFCPHFHLSLQAGCDATLKRMRRLYDTAEFAKIVSDIRNLFDNPAVTTDVMVGFVGETDEDFQTSVDFCDSIGFARTHVFPYSRRKGTAADKMDGHIDERIKRRRAEIMIEHTVAEQRSFMLSQVGKTMPILFETVDRDGFWEGYSPNYTKVKIKNADICGGEVSDVLLTEAFDDYCVGELVR